MAVKPLAFAYGEFRRSADAPLDPPSRREPLWIAAYHPELALDAVDPAARRDRRPTVVVEAHGGHLRVLALNDAARSRGVRPGLDLSAAFAVSGALRVLERSPRAERSLLEAAAATAGRFTPSVSLEPPESVLLEVRASLTLFGGLERLESSLGEALARCVTGFRLSAAPTPLAALWLARGGGADAPSLQALPSRLGPLPLDVTRWPDAVLERLEGMGIATIGECLRLPRDGFARRAGEACLEDLDKALGRRPDLRHAFEAPRHVGFEVDLGDESASVSVLVDAATQMIERLAHELRGQQAQIRQMRLVFEHGRRAPTVQRFEWLDGTCDRERLLDLVRDRIERIELPAPAVAVRLFAGPLMPAILETARLFKGEGQASGGDAEVRLVERLRGRLGAPAVHGLAPAADHRPERAWVATDASEVLRARARARRASPAALESVRHFSMPAERPLWLAPAPEPLESGTGRPCLGGRPLRLLEGPERIESGWWDGEGIARDYYVALGPGDERLWVFRDRTDRRWYLHGRFG